MTLCILGHTAAMIYSQVISLHKLHKNFYGVCIEIFIDKSQSVVFHAENAISMVKSTRKIISS